MASIPQCDPSASYLAQREAIDAAVLRVLASNRYILAGEVAAFEHDFGKWLGVSHVISVANGTDAITIALRALGIGPGCAVATVSHTATATLAAIELAGATPILLDIDEFHTIDAAALPAATVQAERLGMRLAAIAPVHIYGQPADMDAILSFAKKHGAVVVEDCAQALGATWKGQMLGTLAEGASFSFYPTKNLGAIGDGGALTLANGDAASRAAKLRQYGWDDHRLSQMSGINSRLDEIQAGILRVKLEFLSKNVARRQAIAAIYNDGLSNTQLRTPKVREGGTHAYHQYVVEVDNQQRFRETLAAAGVGTAIHYLPPTHMHPTYRKTAIAGGRLPSTEEVCQRIVSLPMFPEMTEAQVNRVIDASRAALR
jgi:dTDP-4-amino-4,6-dideoxygalactose transaminase